MRTVVATLCLLLVGCAMSLPEDAYTVKEVLSDISSGNSKLDGKTISIRGWLGECGGLDCGIYQSLEDAETVGRGDYTKEDWFAAFDRSLRVGGGEDFDRRAFWMQYSEVILIGEVSDNWKKPPDESGNKFGCLDRCDDIKPKSIERLVF